MNSNCLLLNKYKIGKMIFILFFCLFNYFLFTNINYLIDSDTASEIILSQLLSNEKSLISNNWYYSTELRIINTQWIFAPLFSIFDNYQTVRIIGSLIIQIIVLFLIYILCSKLQLNNISYLLLFYISAYSIDYFLFYLRAPLYTSIFVISLLSMILLIDYIYEKKLFKKVVYAIVLIILCFLSSVQSNRQLVVFYFPILCSYIFIILVDKIYKKETIYNKKIFSLLTSLLLISIVAYLLGSSKYFVNKFNFSQYGSNISLAFPTIDQIKDILYCLLECYGYTNNCGIVFKCISLVISSLLMLSSYYFCIKIIFSKSNYSYLEKIISSFYLISMIIMILIFLLTTLSPAGRYLSTNTIWSFIIIWIYINRNLTDNKAFIILIISYLFCILSSFIILNNQITNTKNKEIIEIKEILDKEHIYNGYSTFWNSNILTELSNGKIDVWCYDEYANNENDIIHLKNGEWLQKSEHLLTPPTGKIFFIIEKNVGIIDNTKIEEYCKYFGDKIELYVFENVDSLKASLDFKNR